MVSQVRWAARDYWGIAPRTCNLCGHHGRFRSAGRPARPDARCPGCNSLERHRLLAIVATDTGLFDGKDVLDFAPRPAVERFIESRSPTSYDKSDYGNTATLNLDMESIARPDDSYDVVVASHVLEHVDDEKALHELRRIVRPGGAVVLMVPIVEGWESTHEDPLVTDPDQRHVHFGQGDHVRYYGRDLRDRIAKAGFTIDEYTAEEPAVHRHGLQRGEKVFVCRPT